MLGLGLGLFSALLGPARTRSPMFDRLQRRNNSHGLKRSVVILLLPDQERLQIWRSGNGN